MKRSIAIPITVAVFGVLSGGARAQEIRGDGPYIDDEAPTEYYGDEGPTGYVGSEAPLPEQSPNPAVHEASLENAYNVLSPHGRWVATARFGTVWVPDPRVVGPDFEPYVTNGDWVDTDRGLMFASDFPWGWLAFHYGRWYRHPRYRWVYVPDRRPDPIWAPAWVQWRYGGGYVGWAPLPPTGARFYEDSWIFVHGNALRQRRAWRRYILRNQNWRVALRATSPYRHRHRWRGAWWYTGPDIRIGPRVRLTLPHRRGYMRVHVDHRHRAVFRPVTVTRRSRRGRTTTVIHAPPAHRRGSRIRGVHSRRGPPVVTSTHYGRHPVSTRRGPTVVRSRHGRVVHSRSRTVIRSRHGAPVRSARHEDDDRRRRRHHDGPSVRRHSSGSAGPSSGRRHVHVRAPRAN